MNVSNLRETQRFTNSLTVLLVSRHDFLPVVLEVRQGYYGGVPFQVIHNVIDVSNGIALCFIYIGVQSVIAFTPISFRFVCKGNFEKNNVPIEQQDTL